MNSRATENSIFKMLDFVPGAVFNSTSMIKVGLPGMCHILNKAAGPLARPSSKKKTGLCAGGVQKPVISLKPQHSGDHKKKNCTTRPSRPSSDNLPQPSLQLEPCHLSEQSLAGTTRHNRMDVWGIRRQLELTGAQPHLYKAAHESDMSV